MLNLAFHVRGKCLANETVHCLADCEPQNNSAQEGALLRRGTHHAQHGASEEKDCFGNIHDEVGDDEIRLKSTGNCDEYCGVS